MLVREFGLCQQASRFPGHGFGPLGRLRRWAAPPQNRSGSACWYRARDLRYIEANPVRAKMVERAGDYRWSSFACHGREESNDLLDPVLSYAALAAYPAVRQRPWSTYVHQTPEEAELAAIRRSNETGLPYGENGNNCKFCLGVPNTATLPSPPAPLPSTGEGRFVPSLPALAAPLPRPLQTLL